VFSRTVRVGFIFFVFTQNLDSLKDGIFGAISYNGKGLCEVRATATRSGEENETLAKTIFIFFKFIKKNEMVFLRVLLTNFLRFPSTPHLAKPMLYDVFL